MKNNNTVTGSAIICTLIIVVCVVIVTVLSYQTGRESGILEMQNKYDSIQN
ncbi:hypothetical protein BCF58_0285 [Chryseobacterium defluvii]|uniref:Uncharacterized protein n=1 Tax=Chryseobacterium defluvii TaxID=160396 RepID=A0A495SNY2_9FLAO|nr:hypothetical protein BCF58_0285 [Chryseobacterium defluvii]